MKNSLVSTTLALSLAATAATADQPQMMMSEEMVAKAAAHEADPFAAALPLILMALFILLAGRGGSEIQVIDGLSSATGSAGDDILAGDDVRVDDVLVDYTTY